MPSNTKTLSRRKRIALGISASLLGGGGIAVAVDTGVAGAASCSGAHNATAAWEHCSGLGAGWFLRVRAHVSGIFGGYVYGPWVPDGLTSQVNHANIDSQIVQTCAGAGCP